MDPKTRAIVAYITLFGWIAALVTNNPKDEFASFHIRQMLGLMLASIALSMFSIIPLLGLLALPLYLVIFVLWIMALIGAVQGERKLVPVVGVHFQEWFKNL